MKRIYSLVSFVLLGHMSFGQIQTNELPPNFQAKQASIITNSILIPAPNVSPLLTEDAKDEAENIKPWRFGTLIPINYNLTNSGEWNYNDQLGTEVWRLKLRSPGAKSLNLNFDNFHLHKDAKLFIYTDKKNMIGAITAANNKQDNLFSTRPLQGEMITLELHIPQNTRDKNTVSLDGIIYGYKDFQNKVNKIFQSSGACNINVNCSEGDNWTDQRRSIAMVTTAGNTRFCSGALINNIRQDTTPFFLTAAHCGVRNNSVFIFGYQSPNCSPNTDGSVSNSISGSSRRGVAVNFGSDFDLRILSVRPPASYNVFYSGWSAINTPSLTSTCIHHPSGDVMKISADNDAVTTSGYYRTGITHWQVSNWESGTTEGGSSGSPLFDQNQRIVGQLHGGDASCNVNAQDYFGKLSYSWNNSSDTSRQLEHWLDPDNTGLLIVDGLDPNPAPFANDLHLFKILGIDDYQCSSSIQPKILVRNVGNNTVSSFSVQYRLNNNSIQTQNVTTSLNRNEMTEIQLPSIPLPFGNSSFYAEVLFNNPIIDNNVSNNTDSVSTFANTSQNPEFVVVELKTDDYGSETSWNIIDRNRNEELASGSGYANVNGGQTFRDTICIHNSCFDFNLFDSQGDGFDGNFGNGFLYVTNSLNDTLVSIPTFTGSTLADTFCITTNITSLTEISNNAAEIVAYPNPITKGQLLQFNTNENYNLRLYDLQGRLVQTKNNSPSIKINDQLKNGLYFLEIFDRNNAQKITTKKVLVN